MVSQSLGMTCLGDMQSYGGVGCVDLGILRHSTMMLWQHFSEVVPTPSCWLANSWEWQQGGERKLWVGLRVCAVQVGWFATLVLTEML